MRLTDVLNYSKAVNNRIDEMSADSVVLSGLAKPTMSEWQMFCYEKKAHV